MVSVLAGHPVQLYTHTTLVVEFYWLRKTAAAAAAVASSAYSAKQLQISRAKLNCKKQQSYGSDNSYDDYECSKRPGITLSLLPWSKARTARSETGVKFPGIMWTSSEEKQEIHCHRSKEKLRCRCPTLLEVHLELRKGVLPAREKLVKIGSPIQLTPARSGQGWLFRIDCYSIINSAFIVWRISRRFAQPKNCDIF